MTNCWRDSCNVTLTATCRQPKGAKKQQIVQERQDYLVDKLTFGIDDDLLDEALFFNATGASSDRSTTQEDRRRCTCQRRCWCRCRCCHQRPAAHTTAASSPPHSAGVEFAAVDPVEYDANTGVAWAVCMVATIRTSRSVRSFRLFVDAPRAARTHSKTFALHQHPCLVLSKVSLLTTPSHTRRTGREGLHRFASARKREAK